MLMAVNSSCPGIPNIDTRHHAWKALFRDLGRSSGDPCWDGSLQKWLLMYTVQVSKDLAHSDIKNFRVKVLHFCYTNWPSI